MADPDADAVANEQAARLCAAIAAVDSDSGSASPPPRKKPKKVRKSAGENASGNGHRGELGTGGVEEEEQQTAPAVAAAATAATAPAAATPGPSDQRRRFRLTTHTALNMPRPLFGQAWDDLVRYRPDRIHGATLLYHRKNWRARGEKDNDVEKDLMAGLKTYHNQEYAQKFMRTAIHIATKQQRAEEERCDHLGLPKRCAFCSDNFLECSFRSDPGTGAPCDTCTHFGVHGCSASAPAHASAPALAPTLVPALQAMDLS